MSFTRDLIHTLDRRQGDPETRIVCPKDADHGALGVHKSGIALVCTKCGHKQPVSRP